MFSKGRNITVPLFCFHNPNMKGINTMKNKKTLQNGILVLVAILASVSIFTEGSRRVGLTVITLFAWGVWAIIKLLVPRIREHMAAKKDEKIIRRETDHDRRTKQSYATDPAAIQLMLHVNHRISGFLKTLYPGSTWEWMDDCPARLAVKGGTGRIKLHGIPDYNFADVSISPNAEINCQMLRLEPVTDFPPQNGNGKKKNTSAPPVDPQVWFEQKGRVVLEAVIADLNSRGHCRLTITESGEIFIRQDNSRLKKGELEDMPERESWDRLAKVLQGEGLTTDVKEHSIILSW